MTMNMPVKADLSHCARCGMKRWKGHTCPDRDDFPVCTCGHYSHLHVNELDWCKAPKCQCIHFRRWSLAAAAVTDGTGDTP